MKNLIYIVFIVFSLISISTFGQNDKKQAIINKALKSESIKNQFEILIEKSPTFQNFKNIRFQNLNKFKSNLLDSLKAFDKKHVVANAKIEEQRKEIEKLNKSIESINSNLSSVTEEKDNIDVFGIRTTKATYNTTLWSIILGLLLTTIIFLFKFRSSNKQTKEAKTSFKEIEDEFDTHRKNSLEREQVLRRKLQDEINKQRNI
jgi:uncharacterized MnhB-related membrane protein